MTRPSNPPLKILLLDMDSVLLTPRGYHLALQETTRLLGRALGFPGSAITQQEINQFEAVGITSEWETAAVFACLMLKTGWSAGLPLDLPNAPPLPAPEPHALPRPDLLGFLKGLPTPTPGRRVLNDASRLLLSDLDQGSREARRIEHILATCRRLDGSIVHWIFQELALGSPTFAETYGKAPYLHAPSYLLEHDKSNLDPAMTAMLLTWLGQPHHGGAIFTNRPSSSMDGYFDTPEAELGRALVGLDDLPIVGTGDLGWLASTQGADIGAYLKPSPVHALAGLARAAGIGQRVALEGALAIATGQLREPFNRLAGAVVFVFEDSAKGLASASEAGSLLGETGVSVTVNLLGVTDLPAKRARLQTYAPDIYPTLAEALMVVPGFLDP